MHFGCALFLEASQIFGYVASDPTLGHSVEENAELHNRVLCTASQNIFSVHAQDCLVNDKGMRCVYVVEGGCATGRRECKPSRSFHHQQYGDVGRKSAQLGGGMWWQRALLTGGARGGSSQQNNTMSCKKLAISKHWKVP